MSDNSASCDDCGKKFPLLKLESVVQQCPKCQRLAKHQHGSEEYREILNYPQCPACGKSFRNMEISAQGLVNCGDAACITSFEGAGIVTRSSTKTGPGVLGQSTAVNIAHPMNNAPETYVARRDAMRDRLARHSAPSSRAPSGSENIPLSTTLIQRHEINNKTSITGASEREVTISWKYYRPSTNKPDATLGSGLKPYTLSVYVTDVKMDMLATLNENWVKYYEPIPFLESEISLRFLCNKVLDDGTATMSLADFIEYYSTPQRFPLYLEEVFPEHKKFQKKATARNQFQPLIICFEVLLHTDTYKKCEKQLKALRNLNTDSVLGSGMPTRARSNSVDQAQAKSTASHARNFSTSMASSFRLSGRQDIASISNTSTVEFAKIICNTELESGEAHFHKVDNSLTGYLNNESHIKGTMKCVFGLVFPDDSGASKSSDLYVAKRFFRLHDSEDVNINVMAPSFDSKSHNVQIKAECSRLAVGRWFLNEFYEFCDTAGVIVDRDIKFSDGFLVQELEEPWSKASGMGIFEAEGIMWLVEQWRPSTVIRYSGTLQHSSNNTDLRSSTIYAFAHFVYGYSESKIVFADLQGTPSRVNGKVGLILFDSMTHTTTGDSGIGDYGGHGISSFVHDHVCGYICKRLGFDESVPLDNVDSHPKPARKPRKAPKRHLGSNSRKRRAPECGSDLDTDMEQPARKRRVSKRLNPGAVDFDTDTEQPARKRRVSKRLNPGAVDLDTEQDVLTQRGPKCLTRADSSGIESSAEDQDGNRAVDGVVSTDQTSSEGTTVVTAENEAEDI